MSDFGKIQITSGGKIQLSGSEVKLSAPPPPTPGCPNDVDTLCVTFDGIRVCEVCMPIISTAGPYWDIQENDPVNGAFELDKVFDGQWEGTGGSIHLRKFADFQCDDIPGNIIAECDTVAFKIVVQCLLRFGAPSVSNNGFSGSTTYKYRIVALRDEDDGGNVASDDGGITTGHDVLDGTSFNRIAWGGYGGAGVTGYDIYRVVSDGTPSSTGKIGHVDSLTLYFDDTGLGASDAAPDTSWLYNVLYYLPHFDVCLPGWPGIELHLFSGEWFGRFDPPVFDLENQSWGCGTGDSGWSIDQLYPLDSACEVDPPPDPLPPHCSCLPQVEGTCTAGKMTIETGGCDDAP